MNTPLTDEKSDYSKPQLTTSNSSSSRDAKSVRSHSNNMIRDRESSNTSSRDEADLKRAKNEEIQLDQEIKKDLKIPLRKTLTGFS